MGLGSIRVSIVKTSKNIAKFSFIFKTLFPKPD